MGIRKGRTERKNIFVLHERIYGLHLIQGIRVHHQYVINNINNKLLQNRYYPIYLKNIFWGNLTPKYWGQQ
jgi:hypothetical protein